jgi:hypothetical protein
MRGFILEEIGFRFDKLSPKPQFLCKNTEGFTQQMTRHSDRIAVKGCVLDAALVFFAIPYKLLFNLKIKQQQQEIQWAETFVLLRL